MAKICSQQERELVKSPTPEMQFAMLDLRDIDSLADFQKRRPDILKSCFEIFEALEHRKFLCIHIRNQIDENGFHPIAWDLAKALSATFSLKDEKIACEENIDSEGGQDIFYSLYLRKDEKSNGSKAEFSTELVRGSSSVAHQQELSSWHVIRPPRRKPNEVLHPAKYPEQLVDLFLDTFSNPGDNIFDPMSGTGSSQVAALQKGRNAYGCELSGMFAEVAQARCSEAAGETELTFDIKNQDARKAVENDWPLMDYIVTSPPYWDMLNMKGAEGQAKRKAKGLQLNYSDDEHDLGNIEDYKEFIKELMGVYKPMLNILKPGGYLTIVVKNIKKKGSNYPLAWDLSIELIKEGMELHPEVFWCQDDINIAPYGYGNTWVSNTFHHYCLNFRKPEN